MIRDSGEYYNFLLGGTSFINGYDIYKHYSDRFSLKLVGLQHLKSKSSVGRKAKIVLFGF